MTEQGVQGPRVTVKLKRPNPLFEKWLTEWRNEAIENNSKAQYTYGNALKSLKKYPLPLETGKDCKILKGFGDKLCKMLDQRLEQEQLGKPQNAPKTLRKTVSDNTNQPKSQSSIKKHSTLSNHNFEDRITLEPHSFDIILCVDNNETSGSANSHRDEILTELEKSGVKFEVKSLKIGDFLWICRAQAHQELILPYVIERKRMDDFACSIKDGRYYEQKFRLKKCGIDNLIYLIERHHGHGLPLSSLRQAATNTAIQDTFHVTFTETTADTVRYLTELTRTLIDVFQAKTLISCHDRPSTIIADVNRERVPLMTFTAFNQASVKNKRPKITDLFVKCLVQIKGMSVERALAITRHYPTPRALKSALEACPDDATRDETLARIRYGPGGKTIGTALSKSLVQCFCNLSY